MRLRKKLKKSKQGSKLFAK